MPDSRSAQARCHDPGTERLPRTATGSVPECGTRSASSMRRTPRPGHRRHALRRSHARGKLGIVCARPKAGQGQPGGFAAGARRRLLARCGRDRRPGADRSGCGGGTDARRARSALGRARRAPRHRPEHHRSGYHAVHARRAARSGCDHVEAPTSGGTAPEAAQRECAGNSSDRARNARASTRHSGRVRPARSRAR